MANVFMSYRRDDSPGTTGRLYDWLVRKYRKDHVFKDVYSVPAGSDFRSYIATVLQKSDVFLVLIGPHWLDGNTADSQRRLDDPDDFVRIEIEVAFINEIPVIPVLVEGATPLKEDQLPAPLKRLAHLQAIPVRNDPDFPGDRDKLIATINETIAQSKRPHLPGQHKPAPETARLAAEYVEAATNDAPTTSKAAARQQARTRRYAIASAALGIITVATIVLLLVAKWGPNGPQVNSSATVAASVRATVTANARAAATYAANLASSPSLSLTPVHVALTVDAPGIVNGSPSAINAVEDQLRNIPSIQGKQAGYVLIFGGAPSANDTGTALQTATAVSSILARLGQQGFVFQTAVYRQFFNLDTSLDKITLDIYLFKQS